MTSYTRKLHGKDPAKALAIHRRQNKLALLAQFSCENEIEEANVAIGRSRAVSHIEPEFDVTERLQRWSDRGWR